MFSAACKVSSEVSRDLGDSWIREERSSYSDALCFSNSAGSWSVEMIEVTLVEISSSIFSFAFVDEDWLMLALANDASFDAAFTEAGVAGVWGLFGSLTH